MVMKYELSVSNSGQASETLPDMQPFIPIVPCGDIRPNDIVIVDGWHIHLFPNGTVERHKQMPIEEARRFIKERNGGCGQIV